MKDHDLTVLTIDDHRGVRELMQVLAAEHERVATSLGAADAATALELTRSSRPDVILLDADLGATDGLSLIPSLRDATDDCRIAVVSSAPYADARTALAAGADLFIEKGTDPDVVLERALAR